jgi:hypothetical protein
MAEVQEDLNLEKKDNFDIGPLSLLTKTVKSNA